MEAGWSRMNDLIIIQTSQVSNLSLGESFNPSHTPQGLCAYVLKHIGGAAHRGAVIGHDHRYNSEKWAQLAAAAFIASGVKVYLFPGLVHTPLLDFSLFLQTRSSGFCFEACHLA